MASITQSGKQMTAGREAFAQEQKEQRDELRELCDAGIEAVCTDPVKFAGYLDMMATVPGYTSRNAMLVFQQMPEATHVESAKGWYDQGRYVDNAHKNDGIKIFKPQEKARGTFFDPKMVYDVSQTVGKAIVKKPLQLAENTPEMQAAFDALAEASPVPFSEENDLGVPAVYDPKGKVILVSDAFGDYDTFTAVAGAVAHATLHRQDINDNRGRDLGYDPAEFDFITTSAAYVVSRRFGVPVPDMDFAAPLQTLGVIDAESKDSLLRLIGDTAKYCGDRVQRAVAPKTQAKGPRPRERNAGKGYGGR